MYASVDLHMLLAEGLLSLPPEKALQRSPKNDNNQPLL